MRIALGADHRGVEARQHLHDMLTHLGHEVTVYKQSDENRGCDYPDAAYPVAKAVADGVVDRGILVCGTGIGMSIAANKVPGVRAALAHDEISADLSRRHNDANVLCMSGDMLGLRIMDRIVQTWLRIDFEGGRHARRLHKVMLIERGQPPHDATQPAGAAVSSSSTHG